MIKGKRLNLRPITEDDIEMLRKWRNAYAGNFGDAGHITKEQQRNFYHKYQESQTDRMFIIQLKDGTPIGTIALYNINTTDRTADVGRVILLEEYRGNGYAEEAVKMIVELADEMRLFKTHVWAYLDNLDAIAVYARAGFKVGRPRVYLERKNEKATWREPVKIESYDDMSPEGYEGQCKNIK